MIRALLFDLDGTLVDIDGDAFLDAYVDELAHHLASVVDPAQFVDALMSAAAPLLTRPHRDETNREVLWAALAETLEVPLAKLTRGRDAFPHARLPLILPGGQAQEGAHAVIAAARRRGLSLAVATMPIYPLPVIRERLRRGGFEDIPWDFIANEEMHAVKPHREFFHEVAERLGVSPDECLMVGNDYFQDIAARRYGLATYYIGPALAGVNVGPSGTLTEFAARVEAGLPRHASRRTAARTP